MSMLAEPKKKVKWGLNPRGNLWANDETKFGQQLLEKMGWQKGKGLGKHEDGRTENINVVSKEDNKGVGWDDKTNNWVAHQDEFNNLLADLNRNYADQNGTALNSDQSEDAENSKKKPVSLEVRSKTFKSRVHYKKFVSGKDVSQYSVEDIGCIFGKKLTSSANGTSTNSNAEKDDKHDSPNTEELPEKETELSNFNGAPTFTNSLSVSDYFAQKMKLKALAQKSNDQTADINASCEKIGAAEVDVCKDIVVKKEKKSKKRKLVEPGEIDGITKLKIIDIPLPDRPAFLSDESSSQQSQDSNSSDSECLLDELHSATTGDNTRKMCKKQRKEDLEEHVDSTEINSTEYELNEQPETVQNNCKVAATPSSSAELNTLDSDPVDLESSSKDKTLFEEQIPDTLYRDDSTHSGLKKPNECQSKKKATQNLAKTAPSTVKRHSDIDLLKRYQTLCNNRVNSNDSYRPANSVYRNNMESWNSVLKLARKLKRYECLEKKISVDDFLSSTNICNQRGYGVSPGD